jgi:hypothetical protein
MKERVFSVALSFKRPDGIVVSRAISCIGESQEFAKGFAIDFCGGEFAGGNVLCDVVVESQDDSDLEEMMSRRGWTHG